MRYNESHFSEIFDHQRQFYSSRIWMSIEGVEVDLLTEIPECYDEKGVPNTLTFQQYMLSGVSLATLNDISQPNPITAVSIGATPNTYIISTYRGNMEGLRAIMRLVFPHTIPQYFPKATFDKRFRCNIHPASSARYRNVHSEDLAPILENDILPVVPILNTGGNTPRHARNESIAGNTPGVPVSAIFNIQKATRVSNSTDNQLTTTATRKAI